MEQDSSRRQSRQKHEMEITDTVFPPYLPSTDWFRSGETPSHVRYGRFLTRTRIWSNSPEGMTLTVPVEGGASALKRRDASGLRVSNHGDWTRIHLGAMEAAYGREPYFQHFFPEIAAIIERHPAKVRNLNRSLLSAILTLMDYEGEMDGILRLQAEREVRFASIERRLLDGIDTTHSVIEPLFRYGKDTLLLMSRYAHGGYM